MIGCAAAADKPAPRRALSAGRTSTGRTSPPAAARAPSPGSPRSGGRHWRPGSDRLGCRAARAGRRADTMPSRRSKSRAARPSSHRPRQGDAASGQSWSGSSGPLAQIVDQRGRERLDHAYALLAGQIRTARSVKRVLPARSCVQALVACQAASLPPRSAGRRARSATAARPVAEYRAHHPRAAGSAGSRRGPDDRSSRFSTSLRSAIVA